MSVERAAKLVEDLTRFKRLAAGAPTAEFPASRLSDATLSFNDVAIEVGDWYLTEIRGDVILLRERAGQAEKRTLGQFHRLLKDQRDYSAHPVNFDRREEAEAWRRDVLDGRAQPSANGNLVDALINELCNALDCLCKVAATIAGGGADRQWAEISSTSPEAELRLVYDNLGRAFPARSKYLVLQYSKHPDLPKAKTSQDRANIGELVALGALAAPLRLPYDELLDEFGSVGDPRATALLLLAHGLQALGMDRSRLVKALHAVWDDLA